MHGWRQLPTALGEVESESARLARGAAGVRSACHQVLADLQVVKAFGTVLPTPAQIIHGEASRDDILKRAHAAMYEAKAQGRNRGAGGGDIAAQPKG